MKIIRLLLLCVSFIVLTFPACASLSSKINAVLTKRVPNNNVGIMIINAKTGKTLYAHNAYHYFIPASNTKLFTAAAALIELGPNFTFKTTISKANKNIYLTFGGDPTFTKNDLKSLVVALKNKGITRIQGNFILDTHIFSARKYPIGWQLDDIPYCYAAPITSVTINQNCAPVVLVHTLGKPTQVKYLNSVHIPIKTNIEFVGSKILKTCVFDPEMHDNNHIILKGCLPNKKTRSFGFAIINPTLYAKQLIKIDLVQNGIKLVGQITTGVTPKNTTVIAIKTSAPLYQILNVMLKYSDNLYANAIGKMLGKHYYNVGSFKAGVSAIDAILQQHIGKNYTPPYLEGAAGASTYNLITPHETVMMLHYMYRYKYGRLYRKALPISGQVGTLKNRMGTPPLQNNVYAKTGSMSGISSLSGYLLIYHKTPIIFSIYMNGIRGSLCSARKMQDRIVEIISQST